MSSLELPEVRTSSPDETREVARALADLAASGDVVVLAGGLGAGKTAFAQGFGAGLGVTEPIVSPTFTIARPYEGRLTMHHLDVYRLEEMGELAGIGLTEMLDDGGVLLVEWGDAILPALPADHLEVRFHFGAGDDDRSLTIRTAGERWSARQRALDEAVAPWAVPAC